ncbi:MAG: 6-aminohexanoate-oligomer endohydrolase [Actinomycetota bacterium]|jgi:L-aminopeptidase/D-esterase-like protein
MGRAFGVWSRRLRTFAAVSADSIASVEHVLDGVRVGTVEDEDGPTGCTAIVFDRGAAAAVDVRGGAPGTVGERYGFLSALVFAGGSLLGLAAVTGAADAIHAARGRGTGWFDIPTVAGAILNDYVAGRSWRFPNAALGAAAVAAAEPGFVKIGRVGAGRSATCGKLPPPGVDAGQGAAAWTDGSTSVLVVTVVNAVGSIIGRDGRARLGPDPVDRLVAAEGRSSGSNTTLTAVVTDARLDATALGQLARQVHTSMGRAIQPFHTSTDGDALWALTTGTSSATVSADVLAWRASEVAWDAVLSFTGH